MSDEKSNIIYNMFLKKYKQYADKIKDTLM